MLNEVTNEAVYNPADCLVDYRGIEYPEETKRLILNNIDSLGTADSRHVASTHELRKYFSEMALHNHRVKVEIAHFIKMAQSDEFEEVPRLSEDQIFSLYKLIEDFDKQEAIKIVEYDHFGRNGKGATEHDVKSVELYIGDKLEEIGMGDYKSFIHIYCTSEDINNFSYQSMLRDSINQVMLPKLRGIISRLSGLVETYKDAPMMARTHGQPASPSTFGKEIAVFLHRLTKHLKRLEELTLDVKFNGAVGSYNSHVLAKPDVDWLEYSEQIADLFGFDVSFLTNQRGPMTENVALFQIIQNINRVFIDFSRDIWTYNSSGVVYHRKNADEVGSSVMPHKVNPWFIEEAEGLLKKANDGFDTPVETNDVSRLQRDMTGHPIERDYGSAMGHTLTAWTNIIESLNRIEFDQEFSKKQLLGHPEVVTEGIQTVLRREGEEGAYDILKAISRGKDVTLDTLYDFARYLGEDIGSKGEYAFLKELDDVLQAKVSNIQLDTEIIKQLLSISPLTFVGESPRLAKKGNKILVDFMEEFDKKVATTTRERVGAILFDFDNTLQLGDKEELMARLSHIVSDLELQITDEEMEEVYALSCFREMKAKMIELAKNHGVTVTDKQIQDSNNEVSGTFDDKFVLDEGVRELFKLLEKNRIPAGIISTRGSKSLLRLINTIHDVGTSVDEILSRDDVENRKPDPEGINKALDRLGIGPENVYYVGDKFGEDVKGAQNAGVEPIYIERSDEGISLSEKGKVLKFTNIKELYNYLYANLM